MLVENHPFDSTPLSDALLEFCQDFWCQKKSRWAIVWRCLHDPTFSHFDTVPGCQLVIDKWMGSIY